MHSKWGHFMQIRKAKTKKDTNAFIDLAYTIYKNDPMWIAPLRSELKKTFDPQKNPFLDHCEYALFLLEDNGKVIGRIAALIDLLAVEHWGEAIGMFAYFECPNDKKAADMLFNAAKEWLKAKDMQAIRGPMSFISQEMGMVVEGHSPANCIMSPYNPPYYNELIAGFGFKKIKDLLVYYMDASENYQIPERVLQLTDTIAKRYKIKTRYANMKNIDQEIAHIIKISNASIGNNWGFVPVTDAEITAMAKDLAQIINPRGVIFASDETEEVIGFGVTIPDINIALKGLNGHLLPFGWLKLLWQIPRIKQYRMFALGVMPKYQGKAVDALIYRSLYEGIYAPDARLEINYVLEDNAPMNNAIIKLGAKPLKRYRLYQKPL